MGDGLGSGDDGSVLPCTWNIPERPDSIARAQGRDGDAGVGPSSFFILRIPFQCLFLRDAIVCQMQTIWAKVHLPGSPAT